MLEGTRAALTIADWLIAPLRAAEDRARLPRLQRPDHPHRAAAGARRRRRLGAVQARPGHRPHPARRGAGHQPGSVERGAAAGRGVLRRARRARQRARARSSRSATRSSRSIPSRAPSPESFAETGLEFAKRVREAECELRACPPDAVVPLDQRRAARRRPRLRRADEARRGITHDVDPVRHDAIRDDEPGYVELWPSVGTDAVDEPDDWTLPVDHAQAPAVRGGRGGGQDHQALAGQRRDHRGQGPQAGARRHHGAGAQARPLRACAVAQPEEQATCRWPAPTG